MARDIFKKKMERRDRADKALVFSLSGELGSGKTAFVKGLATTLGIKDRILSPTFVIERRYKIIDPGPFSQLIHIDAYRVSSAEELWALGWEDLVRSSKNIICVEWPENIQGALPSCSVKISFETLSENKRRIIY